MSPDLELYYERYREFGPPFAQDRWDVYVLLRVPMEEIEAERERILEERSMAKEEAEGALAYATTARLGEDFIGAISRLSGVYRRLVQIEPSSGALHRIASLFGEISARISLTLEVLEPEAEDAENLRRLRARAVLLGAEGPIPVGNLPLVLEVIEGAGVVETNPVTGEDGAAEFLLTLPPTASRSTVVEVRLHPSMFPPPPGSPEDKQLLSSLSRSLSALKAASARLSLPPLRAGGVPESAPERVPRSFPARLMPEGRSSEGETHRPVQVLTEGRSFHLGARRDLFPLLIRMTAPPSATRRPRLNIALVLDTSGSMDSPRKLGYLKEAAAKAVQSLSGEDTLAVITYSTETSVLFPSQPFPGRRTLLHLLGMLKAGGRTNLSGGVLVGLAEMSSFIRPDAVSRIILLTDGLANEGITDRGGLARLAEQVREAGVSLTTIGLGRDFDSGLLQQMANEGGGRYYYVDSAEEIPGVLSWEVEGLIAETMGDIAIRISLERGVTLERTYGYPVHLRNDGFRIPAGSLAGGDSRTLLLDLGVSCREEGVRRIASLEVRYRDWLDGGRWRSLREDLEVFCSSHLVGPAPDPDPYLAVYVKLMRALDRLELALNSGDRELIRTVRSFMEREEPSIRAQAKALGRGDLLDLIDLFHHGMEEVSEWRSALHEHEAGKEPDLRRDLGYRLYLARHHGREHRLLRPDWEEEEDPAQVLRPDDPSH